MCAHGATESIVCYYAQKHHVLLCTKCVHQYMQTPPPFPPLSHFSFPNLTSRRQPLFQEEESCRGLRLPLYCVEVMPLALSCVEVVPLALSLLQLKVMGTHSLEVKSN